ADVPNRASTGAEADAHKIRRFSFRLVLSRSTPTVFTESPIGTRRRVPAHSKPLTGTYSTERSPWKYAHPGLVSRSQNKSERRGARVQNPPALGSASGDE